MNILITGGAGFIGSAVCDTYIENGYNVLVVDNLSTGFKENINPNAQFVNCDIRNFNQLNNIFKEFKPNVVNHHAAQINVRKSVDDPTFDADVNIIGSINICKLCVDYKVDKLIFSSTGGAIYGEPEIVPANEETKEYPLAPYGLSKLSVENYIKYFHKTYNLNYVILRYSNVYGQRQNPHGEAGVVAIFCTNILNKKPCVIYGNGNQTRDYVFISDVANANLLALDSENGIYNIGTSTETSVNEIVDILRNVTNRDFDIIHKDERVGEVQRISIDNSKAKAVMGWQPIHNFNDGIEKVWNWYIKSLK